MPIAGDPVKSEGGDGNESLGWRVHLRIRSTATARLRLGLNEGEGHTVTCEAREAKTRLVELHVVHL